MKICCLLDFVPDIKLTEYFHPARTSPDSALYESDDCSMETYDPHRSMYCIFKSRMVHQKVDLTTALHDIGNLVYRVVHTFSGKFGYASQLYRGSFFEIQYCKDYLDCDPRVYYQAICLMDPRSQCINRIHSVEPWFIRAVFEGTEDECLIKKLSSDEKWIPYCDIQQHFEMIQKNPR